MCSNVALKDLRLPPPPLPRMSCMFEGRSPIGSKPPALSLCPLFSCLRVPSLKTGGIPIDTGTGRQETNSRQTSHPRAPRPIREPLQIIRYTKIPEPLQRNIQTRWIKILEPLQKSSNRLHQDSRTVTTHCPNRHHLCCSCCCSCCYSCCSCCSCCPAVERKRPPHERSPGGTRGAR